MSDFLVLEVNEAVDEITAAHSVSDGQTVPVAVEDCSSMPEGTKVVMVVDGRTVAVHAVPLPDVDDSKARKILPAIMDDKIAVHDLENHLALLEGRDEALGTRPVAVVARRIMEDMFSLADRIGVKPDIVVPDFMLVPVPEDTAATLACGSRQLVRLPDGSGYSLESDVSGMVSANGESSAIPAERAWTELLAKAVSTDANLLQGEYAPRTSLRVGLLWWRRSAVLAAAVLALFAGGVFYQASENFRRADALYAQSETVFRQALPDESRIVNMQAQLRRALASRRQQGGREFFVLANVAFRAVAARDQTLLETMRYDHGDGVLTMEVSFASFAESTGFKNALEQAGMQVSEGSSRQEGNRVYSEIRLGRSE